MIFLQFTRPSHVSIDIYEEALARHADSLAAVADTPPYLTPAGELAVVVFVIIVIVGIIIAIKSR